MHSRLQAQIESARESIGSGDDRYRLRLFKQVATVFVNDGNWPQKQRVLRDAARRGAPELAAILRNGIPSEFGYVNNEVVLNVCGLATTRVAQELLSHFVMFVGRCHEIYVGPNEPPVITADELRAMGMNDETIARIHRLLQTENRLIASGSGSATEWSYEISETIVEFGDVDSVEDYVAVSTKLGEQHDESMKALAVSADSVFTSSIPVITPNVVMLDVDSLHPRINTACLSLLISNHYGSAVLEAAKAFAELLRERSGQCETETGKRLDGTRLVEQATVVLMDGISDKQVRQHIEVTRDLGRAMMIGYRNPSAHKLNELPSEEALEAIATFSMLCRRVDATPSAHQVENVQ